MRVSGPAQVREEEGSVQADWPDGAACRLPAGQKMDAACCTCAANLICRHILGTILAYQRQELSASDTPAAKLVPWNPGGIADQAIELLYKPEFMASIRKEWREGLVAEVHVPG